MIVPNLQACKQIVNCIFLLELNMNDKLLNSEEIIHRMKESIGAKNEGQVGEFLGSSKQTVYNWKTRGSIPVEYLVKFSNMTGKSLDWLVFGKFSESVMRAVAPFAIDQNYYEIPLYDIEASAGHGSLFEHERIECYLKFRADWMSREGLSAKDLVAIRVAGDSMDGTLSDGDTVLIDRSRTKPDGVFAIRVGDGLRIKRLQRLTDGSLRVSSDNEMYREEIIHPENLGQVEIVGQCYWRGGRVF